MQFSVAATQLVQALAFLKPFIDLRAYGAALRCVRLEAKANLVRVSGTELGQACTLTLFTAKILEEGVLCLPYKELTTALKACEKSDLVSLEGKESSKEVEEESKTWNVSKNAYDVAMVKKTYYTVDTRLCPYTNDQGVRCITGLRFDGVLEAKKGKEQEAPSFIAWFKMLDAQYPDFMQVVPKKESALFTLTLSRSELAQHSGVVAGLVKKTETASCALTLNGELTIESKITGKAFSTFFSSLKDYEKVREETQPLVIGFNAHYLSQAASLFAYDTVSARFSNEISPVFLQANLDWCVIMPYRL